MTLTTPYTPKKLYIIRHAKAATTPGVTDFDRALTDDGIAHARKVAAKLAEHLILDENTYVLASPSNRTMQTAKVFLDILQTPEFEIHQDESIYDCTAKQLLAAINTVPEGIENLLVFGHNPTVSDLVEYLTRKPAYLRTAAFAEIKLIEGFTFGMLTGNSADLIQIVD